jgi:cyclopropane fatty-acyl-phospholipid synthase-like methyltransferase
MHALRACGAWDEGQNYGRAVRFAVTQGELKEFKSRYLEIIPSMFSAVSDLYAKYWYDFFHFALFENDKESWETAFERTHWQYFEAVNAARARSILDMACGRGAFTHFLAEHSAAQVLGIDISKGQLRHTHRFQRENLMYKRHDIMKVDELGLKFDAVTFLDAACYLPDKPEALRKVIQVMNPGARFLLVDWCKAENLNSLQEELVLTPFMETWAIPDLRTISQYEDDFIRLGFKILSVKDLNSKVRRDWDYGYESAIKGIQEADVSGLSNLIWKSPLMGSRGAQMAKDQFASALYIKAAFDASFLKYAYFLVEI